MTKQHFTKHLISTAVFTALASSTLAIAHANTQQSASQNSFNESDVEVIKVTADLGQRNLSELPATASIINQLAIEQRQARHLQDLLGMVPNLNFSAGASRGKFIQIRGIGERSQFIAPINPSIGIILDDIDMSGIGILGTLADAQQVEVLSGPQSVATGINSLGGIVKTLSNRPTDSLYANISASYAQFNEHNLSGVYSNALNDSINARFSISNTQSNGFVKNAFLNRDDTNNIDETTASALFDITLSNNTSLDLNLYHFDIANGYDAFSLDNTTTLSDQPGFDEAKAHAISAKLSHSFESHLLQVTAHTMQADTKYAYDEDWTFDGISPIGYMSFDQYNRDYDRSGLDVKIASDSNSAGQYLIGFNISKQDEDLSRIYTFDSDYESRYRPDSKAIYGQYAYSVNEKINITSALRLEKFEAQFTDNRGFTARVDDTLLAGVVSVDYKIQQSFLFASISRGYKAAGFNIDSRFEPENRAFSPEYNINYEAGIKGTTNNGATSLNLTFFYMQRDDAQVSDSLLFPEEDENGTIITSFAQGIGNSDTGVNQGIEFSSAWDVSDDWLINANVGYLDASIGDYTQLNGEYVAERDQAQAPKFTGYFASNLQISNKLSWFVDIELKDDFRFTDSQEVTERIPFSTVVNSELRYQADHYSVKLWVKNMFDRKLYTRGFGSFPNDPRDGYTTNGPYFQSGQERQVGVSLSYTWE